MSEPALSKEVPGFSLLSERHDEGSAAHSLELSSQAFGLFQVCHGDDLATVTAASAAAALVPFLMGLGCLPAKGASRNFSIERLVLLPGMMAMASLATAAALPWL
jgi:hypothetical protein